jgi:lysophospholipase L1-like esterase
VKIESKFTEAPVWQQVSILAAFLMVVALALAGFAETGVRVRHWLKYGNLWGIEDTYTIDPASGLRIPVPGGTFGPIRINALGFRSPEIDPAKPSGRLRIAFLGGSTTYCAEVSSNEMTWPHLVWTGIQRHWPKADIDYINAGVPGYGTPALRQNLESRVAPLKPDVLVIYEATNDLSGNSYRLAQEQGVAESRADEPTSWLSRNSLLVYLLHKNLSIIRQQQKAEDNRPKAVIDHDRLAAMFRADLVALVEASKRVAKVTVLVTFSSRLRPEQTPDARRAAAITSLHYMPSRQVEDIFEGFRRYNQVIREVAAEQNVMLIDEEDAIPADQVHYVDSVHFTDAGSARMALRVLTALARNAKLDSLAHAAERRF